LANRSGAGGLGRSRQRREDARVVEGTIAEALPNAMYAVQLDDGQRITAHIAGIDRTRLIRVVPGNRVTIELSPYDLSRGRITDRHR
jgi:translation initiation factor IF-1